MAGVSIVMQKMLVD